MRYKPERALKHSSSLRSFLKRMIVEMRYKPERALKQTATFAVVSSLSVTTQAREGIETSQDTWRKIKAGGNNSSP